MVSTLIGFLGLLSDGHYVNAQTFNTDSVTISVNYNIIIQENTYILAKIGNYGGDYISTGIYTIKSDTLCFDSKCVPFIEQTDSSFTILIQKKPLKFNKI